MLLIPAAPCAPSGVVGEKLCQHLRRRQQPQTTPSLLPAPLPENGHRLSTLRPRPAPHLSPATPTWIRSRSQSARPAQTPSGITSSGREKPCTAQPEPSGGQHSALGQAASARLRGDLREEGYVVDEQRVVVLRQMALLRNCGMNSAFDRRDFSAALRGPFVCLCPGWRGRAWNSADVMTGRLRTTALIFRRSEWSAGTCPAARRSMDGR